MDKIQTLLKLQTSLDNWEEAVEARKEDAEIILRTASNKRKILDIGCGLGICMSLLKDQFKEIHLLDKDEFPQKGALENIGINDTVFYSEKRLSGYAPVDNFGFYNDLKYAKELVSKENPNTIVKTFTPENMPEDSYDVIISLFSWGFHYPFDTYIGWALKHLEPEGIIIMTLNKKAAKDVLRDYNYLIFKEIEKKNFSGSSHYMVIHG